MGVLTISSRKFNQDVSGAKRRALTGPVVITDRGRPAHVLLSIEEYRKITGRIESIVELLALSEGTDIDFDPVRRTGEFYRPANLS